MSQSSLSVSRVRRALIGMVAMASVATACGGGDERVAGTVAGSSSAACSQIQERIAASRQVDVAAAKQCDQAEFAALENQRQAARAQGQKPAMQNSNTCEAVNKQAAEGDEALNFDLAFHCRQRERFAIATNAQNGLGQANQLTSLCKGAQAKKANGQDVDAFTESFCGQEQAKARQDGDNAQQGSAQGQQEDAGATGQKEAAGEQATGDVVCPGSTVTLSGESGTPAASSNQLPVGTRVKVTNLDNDKSTTVSVTGGSGSCMLLNNAAFEQVRELGKFLIRRATIERVG